MRRRIDKRLLPLSSSSSTSPRQARANEALATGAPFDEKRELEQVNVLYSFLENRYHKKVRGENGNLTPCIYLRWGYAEFNRFLHVVSSLRSHDETRLEPCLLRQSPQRVSRSTATIMVSDHHKQVEGFPALFLSQPGEEGFCCTFKDRYIRLRSP